MKPEEIIAAIGQLPVEQQRAILAVAQENLRRLESQSPDDSDWSNDWLKGSIISREDEKNVQRIWKSPGGC